jgi:hypothetical protein
MKENIADKVETLIKNNTPDNEQIVSFIKADEEYQKLIQEGLTSKRGYNLLTTEEIYHSSSSYVLTQSTPL